MLFCASFFNISYRHQRVTRILGRIKMWVATVDIMKAFYCIESQYISFFRRLYADQKGTPKQGDPLSRLLFNTVLQMVLKDDATRWQKKNGMGICVGDSESDCLTDLCFADDALLFSTSQVQLQTMMCDFKQSTERVGLKIHRTRRKFSATKVQTEEKKWRSTTLKLRHYLRARARNILDKQLRFSIRKLQRSKIESEPPGLRTAGTNKS